jgi:hypothetical protein
VLSASPSEGAGSVETTRVRAPDAASRIAMAAAQVVLPTPPFPPMNRKRGPVVPARNCVVSGMLVAFQRGVDFCDLVVRRRETARFFLATLADFPQAAQDVRLERLERFVAHFPEFDAHLRREELIAERTFVVQLGVDGSGHLVQHEPQSTDKQGVEDDQWARSSFNRMLTKL